MRAIVYAEKGSSSVLRLVDRPVPSPGPGQVLVRMVRAGVNPTDWKSRAGPSSASGSSFSEVTPGQDGAGVVDAVGSGVSSPAAGDRVWLYLGQHGTPHGTAAEYCVLGWQRAVPLPAGASFDLGACLGVPAITAHRALTSSDAASRLGPGALAGQVALVHGGAGAVGNAAIQLAVWSGATVLSTVSSSAKAALALAAGAHHTVNYRTTDAAAEIGRLAPDGVDLIVEVSPAVNNELDLAVARNGATIAIYANNGGDTFPVSIRATFAKNLRYQFLLLYTLSPSQLAAAAEDVTAAIAAGALRAGEEAGLPLHHYPLVECGAAHDAVEGGATGKVLIDIADLQGGALASDLLSRLPPTLWRSAAPRRHRGAGDDGGQHHRRAACRKAVGPAPSRCLLSAFVIYQDPLAYLLGLEGIALLDAWAGAHDRAFTEARLAEIRRLLDDEQLRDRGVLAQRVTSVTAYEQQSADYDEHAGGGLFTIDEPFVAEFLGGREAGVALDAACGTGRFADFLARRGHRVIGVDSSPDMLAHARRRVPDGEFHVGELDWLPLADESVDVIVCALALVHVPRLEPVLAEFERVLRPGGDLIISDIHHEHVTRGSVITARGPAGEPCIVATYRHKFGDYLRAALSSGLQVVRCEEPFTGTDGPLPEAATRIGDWQDWPWSLLDYVPAAARATAGPPLVIWHFRLPVT